MEGVKLIQQHFSSAKTSLWRGLLTVFVTNRMGTYGAKRNGQKARQAMFAAERVLPDEF
jgi:hypothetical protein